MSMNGADRSPDAPPSVLVVDDELEVAEVLKAFLELRGLGVHAVGTLAAARRHADAHDVDVVLLDLALPDGRGELLLRDLRARPCPPDVLVITGHATVETAIAAVDAGAAGYIAKPIDLATLDARIGDVLQRRRAAADAARLQQRLAERLRETEAMLSMAVTVSSTLDLPEALRRICQVLAGLVAADTGSVYLLNRDTGMLVPFAGYHVPKDHLDVLGATPIRLEDQAFYEPLWASRTPVWSDDVAGDPRFSHELFRRVPHQSGLLLPVVLDGAVAGVVYFVWWRQRRRFAAHELDLLTHVCGQLTSLLKNARGWEQAQRDRERLRAMNEVARRLAAVHETDDVLSLIVDDAERLLGGAAAGIRLVEGDRLVVRARSQSAAPVMARPRLWIGESLSGHVIETGTPVLVTDLAADARFDALHKANALGLGFTSYLGVPLRVGGRVIGCFNVFLRDNRRFTPDDTELLTALADHAALALENTRLLEVSERQRAELARIFDSTSDGILLLDRDGTVLMSNRRAGELLAFSAAAAEGVHVVQVLPDVAPDADGSGALWRLPASMMTPVVARLKVLAGLRIDERRSPQDGRFDVDLGGYRLDLRASTLPTHWGEKVVLRVQSKDSMLLDLEDLGLTAADYQTVLRNVMRPWGMILITGPTGCGKTTSLYSMLSRVGAERHNVVNISTVEDPVEYPLARVNQMPVNPAAGVEFATGLRALLRQDPDIIMVGEIRDRETAQIAVRCALVGRLLLSTLHTNDSTGAVPRLLDMEVEPFLVSSTLSLVIAQRLVRRICVNCRVSVAGDEKVLGMLRSRPDFERTTAVLRQRGALGSGSDPWAGVRLFRGSGCPQCSGSGFRGRIGLFELYEVDAEARDLIMARASAAALREAALASGMTTMFQDGLSKALLGETTLEEVLRVAF
jgi:type II secretory ATPase GspE/PulE/Tfp pilus assembly ATPase PilB-like protein/GAF domain-containing protein